MSNRSKQYILSDEPVTKALIHLSVPSILSNLVGTFHNMIDTFFISQLRNNSMIAATSVALPIMVLIYALGEGIGAGAESCIGRAMGAKENERVKDTVSTSMAISVFLVIVSVIFTVTLLKPSIYLFTESADVVEYAYEYMYIMTMGSVFVIFKQVFTHLLRSCGDVQTPMKTVFIEVVINTVLNPIFMFDFGLGMKIRGAALATVIAQGISTVLLFRKLILQKSEISWKIGNFKVNSQSLKEIIGVGSAVFVRNGLPSLSYGLFARSAALFGTDYVAASSLARKGEQAANFVIQGIAQGYQPFASYNYGAKRKDRLVEAIKKTIGFTMIYGLCVSVLFYFSPQLIMRIFTSDASLLNDGTTILKCYAISMPVIGIYQILAASFQSMGKSSLSFIASIIRQGILYCPLIVLLPRWFDEIGFAMVQPVCDWLSVMVTILLAGKMIKEIKAMENAL